jgi:hypothetical protein
MAISVEEPAMKIKYLIVFNYFSAITGGLTPGAGATG